MLIRSGDAIINLWASPAGYPPYLALLSQIAPKTTLAIIVEAGVYLNTLYNELNSDLSFPPAVEP